MSYPNIPIGVGQSIGDWVRRASQAINYLLNITEYVSIDADGVPSAGQELLNLKFPFPVTINTSASGLACDVAPTADAVFAFSIGGASAGSATIAAGQNAGTLNLTTTTIPAWTRFIVTAPNPADATLADITLALALG